MKAEVIDKLTALVTAAFGLVAALAWNEAIQSIFKRVFGETKSMGPMIVYAIIVTVIAVVVTLWIGRAASKLKNIEIDADKLKDVGIDVKKLKKVGIKLK